MKITELDFTKIRGINKQKNEKIISFMINELNCKSIDDTKKITIKDLKKIERVGTELAKKIIEYIKSIDENKERNGEKKEEEIPDNLEINNDDVDKEEGGTIVSENKEEENKEQKNNSWEILPRNSLLRLELESDKKIKIKNAEVVYNQLRENKIYDLDALLMYTKDELANILDGVGTKKAELILKKAQEIAGIQKFVSLSNVESSSDDVIWTGSLQLDNLLGGGFFINDSYEIYGSYGGGKTQICATVACRVQLPKSKGGLREEGKPIPEVLWIDTEDTLVQMKRDRIVKEKVRKIAETTEKSVTQVMHEIVVKRQKGRLIEISESLGLDFHRDVEPYITHVPVISVEDQMRSIEEALEYANEHNWKVIILDSITKLIRAERTAKESYNVRISRNINNMIANLQRLKQKCGAVLICTNQVWNKVDVYGGKRYSEETYGGSAVTHNLNNRIHVWHWKDGIRLAELKDSCYLKGSNDPVPFIITDAGIGDIEIVRKKK